MKKIPYVIHLEQKNAPKQWVNMPAFLPGGLDPMLNPGTGKPVSEEDLQHVFSREGSRQELDQTNRYVDIPEEVQEYYQMYRPSPLMRAYRLEKALNTPAEIYYKFEGGNTSGSHKLNSAIAQAYYAKQEGLTGLTTETGAGQWGTALSMACGYFGLQLQVFMVKTSAEQKPYRKTIMEIYGAKIISSPSDSTEAGRRILKETPDHPGSLGVAISEAVEAAQKQGYRYALGSVLNQVLLHQTVVGLEAKAAMEQYDIYPDIVIGCAGGGSNLGGLMAPFLVDRLEGRAHPYFIAAETASCPSLTRGRYAYDFCDTGHVTPLAKMYTLGSCFVPPKNHAGGLRYHGMSPILSHLYHDGLLDEAQAFTQNQVFSAAVSFAKTEGILPAPESAHAIFAAIKQAEKCRESGEKKVILFGLTGTGYLDLAAYRAFLDSKLSDKNPEDQDLNKCFSELPMIE